MTGTQQAARSEQTGRRLVAAGLVMQLSVLIGLAGTIRGIRQAFESLGQRTEGVADPSRLSMAIGEVLCSTFLGMIGNNIGAALILVALWRYHLRSSSLFWLGVAVGFIVFPLGLALMIYCLVYRHEFSGAKPTTSPGHSPP